MCSTPSGTTALPPPTLARMQQAWSGGRAERPEQRPRQRTRPGPALGVVQATAGCPQQSPGAAPRDPPQAPAAEDLGLTRLRPAATKRAGSAVRADAWQRSRCPRSLGEDKAGMNQRPIKDLWQQRLQDPWSATSIS